MLELELELELVLARALRRVGKPGTVGKVLVAVLAQVEGMLCMVAGTACMVEVEGKLLYTLVLGMAEDRDMALAVRNASWLGKVAVSELAGK